MPDTHITRLISLAATGSGRSTSTVSRQATGSGATYARLQNGADITVRRAARATQWLSDHWPPAAEWPADIPRPPPTPPTEDAA